MNEFRTIKIWLSTYRRLKALAVKWNKSLAQFIDGLSQEAGRTAGGPLCLNDLPSGNLPIPHAHASEHFYPPPAESVIAQDIIPILAGLLDICGGLIEDRWPAPFRPPIGEKYLEEIFTLTAALNQLRKKVYG